MKLHTAGPQAEWVRIAPNKRNAWQRLAARTHGMVAPANVVTLLGLAGVGAGIVYLSLGRYWTALVLIAAGRAADILDGWVADKTGTKSPLGEMLDATVDKMGTISVLLILPALRIVPWWLAGVLLVPQAIATGIGLAATSRRVSVHPTRLGKLGMAAAWLSLLSFVGLRLWPHNRPITSLAYVLAAASFCLAFLAINEYRRVFQGR